MKTILLTGATGYLGKRLGKSLLSDSYNIVIDISKANKIFNWSPKVDSLTGIRNMLKWVEKINAK